jgi:DNA-binding NarL/FixJ family response regulator
MKTVSQTTKTEGFLMKVRGAPLQIAGGLYSASREFMSRRWGVKDVPRPASCFQPHVSGIRTRKIASSTFLSGQHWIFVIARSLASKLQCSGCMGLRRNDDCSNVGAASVTAEAEVSQPNTKNRGNQAPNPALTPEKMNKPKANRQSDLIVCGEEEDASRALSAISTQRPDLVIADISLKDSSGLELMRNIKAQYPGMPILVVSVHDESIYAEIAFRAGALGYLMKQEALDKILIAIRRVLEGNIYVSDVLAARMLQQQVRGQTDVNESPVKSLSDRELEVFQLIGQWKKTKEIAQELHLSVKTVEYYREQIKRKLNLRDAAELTQHATSWVQREISTDS